MTELTPETEEAPDSALLSKRDANKPPLIPPDLPRDMKRLLRRIDFWQRHLAPLGLAPYRTHVGYVEETQGKEGAAASCHNSVHYDTVWFEFRQDYVEKAEKWQLDETIIHEWLHVLFRDYDSAVNYAGDYMSPQVREMWECQVEHELEGVIEKLARTIRMLHAK
jgi:hypothetical protein